MAKKSKENSGKTSFTRIPSFMKPALIIAVIALAGWLFWENGSDLKETLFQYAENSESLTLESKFTPDQIMESRRSELIGNTSRTYREPIIKYYPYLLMDVKYTENKKSRSGQLLWGMYDGEIVVNTDTWEFTRGFKECLECRADRNDLLIIQALLKNQGVLSIENLQQELHLEHDALDAWLASALKKHLIVKKGNTVHLHFDNPRLISSPQSKIQQNWVFFPILYQQKASKKYSKSQIAAAAKAVFGPDFTIRSEKEVFLPVYLIEVQNTDGSIYTTAWNALTGRIYQL
jgi:hypothetical protein